MGSNSTNKFKKFASNSSMNATGGGGALVHNHSFTNEYSTGYGHSSKQGDSSQFDSIRRSVSGTLGSTGTTSRYNAPATHNFSMSQYRSFDDVSE
jgi:hypothetical protein